MSDWKKVKNWDELKKEGENGQIISSARISDGDSIGSSRNVHRVSVHKEVNNDKKGGNRMITVEGALKDLEVIEKEANDAGSKAVVKALKVVVKFLSTMRSNQLLTEEEKVVIRKAREARTAKETK